MDDKEELYALRVVEERARKLVDCLDGDEEDLPETTDEKIDFLVACLTRAEVHVDYLREAFLEAEKARRKAGMAKIAGVERRAGEEATSVPDRP